MLTLKRRALFATTFLVTLSVLIVFIMATYGALQTATNVTVGDILALFYLAGFFLVFSGYLIAFVIMYCLFSSRFGRFGRILTHVLLFIASYLFFSELFFTAFTEKEAALLLAFVIAVMVSDGLAEKVSSHGHS